VKKYGGEKYLLARVRSDSCALFRQRQLIFSGYPVVPKLKKGKLAGLAEETWAMFESQFHATFAAQAAESK